MLHTCYKQRDEGNITWNMLIESHITYPIWESELNELLDSSIKTWYVIYLHSWICKMVQGPINHFWMRYLFIPQHLQKILIPSHLLYSSISYYLVWGCITSSNIRMVTIKVPLYFCLVWDFRQFWERLPHAYDMKIKERIIGTNHNGSSMFKLQTNVSGDSVSHLKISQPLPKDTHY